LTALLSSTTTFQPDDILKGRITLEDLPEPYLIIQDRLPMEKLSKVINILATHTEYRIAFFSVTPYFGYVIMEKKKEMR
jgi:hypothetical protein